MANLINMFAIWLLKVLKYYLFICKQIVPAFMLNHFTFLHPGKYNSLGSGKILD